eukprot:jgi/Chlat1/8363/Chrsp80S07795
MQQVDIDISRIMLAPAAPSSRRVTRSTTWPSRTPSPTHFGAVEEVEGVGDNPSLLSGLLEERSLLMRRPRSADTTHERRERERARALGPYRNQSLLRSVRKGDRTSTQRRIEREALQGFTCTLSTTTADSKGVGEVEASAAPQLRRVSTSSLPHYAHRYHSIAADSQQPQQSTTWTNSTDNNSSNKQSVDAPEAGSGNNTRRGSAQSNGAANQQTRSTNGNARSGSTNNQANGHTIGRSTITGNGVGGGGGSSGGDQEDNNNHRRNNSHQAEAAGLRVVDSDDEDDAGKENVLPNTTTMAVKNESVAATRRMNYAPADIILIPTEAVNYDTEAITTAISASGIDFNSTGLSKTLLDGVDRPRPVRTKAVQEAAPAEKTSQASPASNIIVASQPPSDTQQLLLWEASSFASVIAMNYDQLVDEVLLGDVRTPRSPSYTSPTLSPKRSPGLPRSPRLGQARPESPFSVITA